MVYVSGGVVVENRFVPVAEPRIVYHSGGIVVVAKPAGMHSAPSGRTVPSDGSDFSGRTSPTEAVPGAGLSTGPGMTAQADETPYRQDLCTWLADRVPEVGSVRGWKPGEGGLLHRLDRDTSGLVVFAADDDTFQLLSAAASDGGFRKVYSAWCVPVDAGLPGSRPLMIIPGQPGTSDAMRTGFRTGTDSSGWQRALRRQDAASIAALLGGVVISSRFRPYGPGAVRVACQSPDIPVVRGKDWTRTVYSTVVEGAVALDQGRIRVDVSLVRGFRHQIRAHMAWMGLPLAGDSLYGEGDGALHLLAGRVELRLPGRTVVVTLEDS